MIPAEWLVQARQRLAGAVLHTPMTYDSEHGAYLKWENQQLTGSFKVRGALNKVLSLQPWERQRGLVTASAGNHGQGVALAAQRSGAHAIVFASEQAVPAKLEAMRALGADVRLVPGLYAQAEQAGINYARETNLTWISPYNDAQVIAGQSTLGFEIIQDLAAFGETSKNLAVAIPIGGGGLAAGVGLALQGKAPRLYIAGVQAETSPYFHALYYRGSQEGITEGPTLADGLEGAVEAGSLTIPLVRSVLDEIVLVGEDEIGRAVALAYRRYGEVIEGAAGAALAAVLSGKIIHRPVVVLLTGGNIQPELHQELVSRWMDTDW
jgi:threonine dehydratase